MANLLKIFNSIFNRKKNIREGWDEAFKGAEKEQLLLDEMGNDFDQDEWEWEGFEKK